MVDFFFALCSLGFRLSFSLYPTKIPTLRYLSPLTQVATLACTQFLHPPRASATQRVENPIRNGISNEEGKNVNDNTISQFKSRYTGTSRPSTLTQKSLSGSSSGSFSAGRTPLSPSRNSARNVFQTCAAESPASSMSFLPPTPKRPSSDASRESPAGGSGDQLVRRPARRTLCAAAGYGRSMRLPAPSG